MVFIKRIRAGRRTYFFDVRTTRANDYYLTITESKKRPDDTYVKHKIFVYKEDFNKFVAGLDEAVAKIKTELMPDFNFEQFDRPERPYDNNQQGNDNYNANYSNQPNPGFEQPSGNYQTNEPIENSNDYNTAPQPRVDSNVNDAPSNEDDLKW